MPTIIPAAARLRSDPVSGDTFAPAFDYPELSDTWEEFFDVARASWTGLDDYGDKRLTLLDLTATYSTKWGDFSIGVENLLNHYYILPWAQIDQFQNYFAGRGRVISISHVVKF